VLLVWGLKPSKESQGICAAIVRFIGWMSTPGTLELLRTVTIFELKFSCSLTGLNVMTKFL